MRYLAALLCLGLLAGPAYAGSIAENVASLNVPQDKLRTIGEAIFNTAGANTCLKCHGKGGHGGDQAGAADLRHPRTWRSYQALGGDPAFSANPDQFRQHMETALLYLIRNSATSWNLKFAKKHKDIVYPSGNAARTARIAGRLMTRSPSQLTALTRTRSGGGIC